MKKPTTGDAGLLPHMGSLASRRHGFMGPDQVLITLQGMLREASEAAGLGDGGPAGDPGAGEYGALLDVAARLERAQAALVTQLQAAREEARWLQRELCEARTQAKTDPLTALANRQAFLERLLSMLRAGDLAQGEHCLLMLDIDNFKRINDTHGHLFGDEVIRSVARILEQSIKGKDMAARFGGEEFLVLLPHTSLRGATAVAQSIRRTMEREGLRGPELETVNEPLTVSLGVTPLCPGDSIERAVARADDALYQAKAAGRNCIRVNTDTEKRPPDLREKVTPARRP